MRPWPTKSLTTLVVSDEVGNEEMGVVPVRRSPRARWIRVSGMVSCDRVLVSMEIRTEEDAGCCCYCDICKTDEKAGRYPESIICSSSDEPESSLSTPISISLAYGHGYSIPLIYTSFPKSRLLADDVHVQISEILRQKELSCGVR